MRNTKWAVILTLVVLSMACSCQPSPCDKYLQKEYVEANLKHEKLFEANKLNEAIALVESIVKEQPDNYIAISYLGAYKYSWCQKTECSAEQLKEVYDLYKKSIAICPDFRVGYFNTIQVLTDMSGTQYSNDFEIVKYLELYNSRWEKRSDLLAKGGAALFRLGRIDESLLYLNEAIALDSTEALAYVFKGKCLSSRNEWAQALDCLNTGLSFDSLSLGFHERGYVNLELGRIEDAIQDYQTAISLYSGRFESYIGLGQIEVKRNNLQQACLYFQQALTVKPDNGVAKAWIQQYCEE